MVPKSRRDKRKKKKRSLTRSKALLSEKYRINDPSKSGKSEKKKEGKKNWWKRTGVNASIC